MLKLIKRGIMAKSSNYMLKTIDLHNNYIQLTLNEFRKNLESSESKNIQEQLIIFDENSKILNRDFRKIKISLRVKDDLNADRSIIFLPKRPNFTFLNSDLLSEINEVNEKLNLVFIKLAKKILLMKSTTISERKEKFYAIRSCLQNLENFSKVESLINYLIFKPILSLINESDNLKVVDQKLYCKYIYKHLRILSIFFLYTYNLEEKQFVELYSKKIFEKINELEKYLDLENLEVIFKYYTYIESLEDITILIRPKIYKIIQKLHKKIQKSGDMDFKYKFYFNYLLCFDSTIDIKITQEVYFFFNQHFLSYFEEFMYKKYYHYGLELDVISNIFHTKYIKTLEIIISNNFKKYLDLIIQKSEDKKIFTNTKELKSFISSISLYNRIPNKNKKEFFILLNKIKAIWYLRTNFKIESFYNFHFCFLNFFNLTISNFYTFLNNDDKIVLLSMTDYIIENNNLLSRNLFFEILIYLNQMLVLEEKILKSEDKNLLTKIQNTLEKGFKITSIEEYINPRALNHFLKNPFFVKYLDKNIILNEYILNKTEIEIFHDVISIFELFNNLNISEESIIMKFENLINKNLEPMITDIFCVKVKVPQNLRKFNANVKFIDILVKRNNYFLNGKKKQKKIIIKIFEEIINNSLNLKYFENSFGSKSTNILNTQNYFKLQTICLNFFYLHKQEDLYEKTKKEILSQLKYFLKVENLKEFINVLENINFLINYNKEKNLEKEISKIIEEYLLYFHKKILNFKSNEAFFEHIANYCFFLNKIPFYIIDRNENLKKLLENITFQIFINKNFKDNLKYDIFVTLSQFLNNRKYLIKSILKVLKLYDDLKLTVSCEEDLYFKIHDNLKKLSLGLKIIEKRGLITKLKKEIKQDLEKIHEDYNCYSDWRKFKKEDSKYIYYLAKGFCNNVFYKENIKFEESFRIYDLEYDFLIKEKNILIKFLNKNQGDDIFDINLSKFLVEDKYYIHYIELKSSYEYEDEIFSLIKEIKK